MVSKNPPFKSRVAVWVTALLALAVFGACAADAAQAETAVWDVNGAPVVGGYGETVAAGKVTSPLVFAYGGLITTCRSVTTSGGKIFAEGKGEFERMAFSGCEESSAPEACQINSIGEPVGTLAFGPTTTTLEARSGHTYLVLKPKLSAFMHFRVSAKSGKSCPASAENLELTGELATETPHVTSPKQEAIEQPLTTNEAIATAAGKQLFLGKSKASMSFQFNIRVTGAYEGKPFGVLLQP